MGADLSDCGIYKLRIGDAGWSHSGETDQIQTPAVMSAHGYYCCFYLAHRPGGGRHHMLDYRRTMRRESLIVIQCSYRWVVLLLLAASSGLNRYDFIRSISRTLMPGGMGSTTSLSVANTRLYWRNIDIIDSDRRRLQPIYRPIMGSLVEKS